MTVQTADSSAPAGLDADPAWIAAHPRVQRVPSKDLTLFIRRDFLSAEECVDNPWTTTATNKVKICFLLGSLCAYKDGWNACPLGGSDGGGDEDKCDELGTLYEREVGASPQSTCALVPEEQCDDNPYTTTATGKVKHGAVGKRHRLISHNAKYIRQHRGTDLLAKQDVDHVKKWAPYGLK